MDLLLSHNQNVFNPSFVIFKIQIFAETFIIFDRVTFLEYLKCADYIEQNYILVYATARSCIMGIMPRAQRVSLLLLGLIRAKQVL